MRVHTWSNLESWVGDDRIPCLLLTGLGWITRIHTFMYQCVMTVMYGLWYDIMMLHSMSFDSYYCCTCTAESAVMRSEF